MRQDNQPVTHGNCTPQTLSPRRGPRLGTETERRGPALREAVVDRGEGRSGRCHRGGGSDVFIRGALSPLQAAESCHPHRDPGAVKLSPLFTDKRSQRSSGHSGWDRSTGRWPQGPWCPAVPSHARAGPRTGSGLGAHVSHLLSAESPGVPPRRVPPEAQTAGLTCPGPRAWHTPDLSLSLGLDDGQR